MAEDGTEQTDPNAKTITVEELEAGDYVKLKCNVEGMEEEQTILCKVLYDKAYNETNKTDYGIQLVAVEPTETVTLGFKDPRAAEGTGLGESQTAVNGDGYNFSQDPNDIERAQWSYNNAIETLNLVAQKYTGTNIQSARCVGSVPDDPLTEEAGMYMGTFSYLNFYGCNGVLKSGDNNYDADDEQLEAIGAMGFSKPGVNTYWLASRYVTSDSNGTQFRIRTRPFLAGQAYNKEMYSAWDTSMGKPDGRTWRSGFRPCFELTSGAQIQQDASHDGKTEDTAYEL